MFEKIILLCWAIWHSRNKRIFEGKHTEAVEIVAFADKYWKELHAATSVVLQPGVRSDRNSVRWEPPENDVVKINFDATCVRQPLDPTSAEAKAAVLAVHLARERNWTKVIIEGDSFVVISAIKGTSDSRAGYGNIIMDIQRISEDFEEFRVQHILREGNRVAHEVASLSKQGDYHLFDLPPLIHSVISLEMC
ncbi:PREDICTED: uncharacterized protein LOC105954713 [Erythranthe guttata]|uniref:uncharacterized protein LOC105954713 n=1 Tax=Erythranthe guttata TaxID=4155 RepID=UPI00064DFEA9|nr:PREDICTED: uncharacterized protein LOC105954713 [Erythranthe guttata]|eukprot:XP_012833848.1 PREDICTED: uncharacterized protein LOC105954713 [Erythranthe guttata]